MPSPEDWAVERDGEAEYSVHTRRCRNWESYALERETVMESIFNAMFILVPLFIGIIFLVVIGSIIVAIVRGIAEWRNNNAQPLLKVTASVVTKRQHVSGGGNDTSASTHYYTTFETVDDGLRQEFSVSPTEYSGMADGDVGSLTYQGTRFKGFVRQRHAPKPPPLPVATTPVQPDWTCAYCRGRVASAEAKCTSCGSASRQESEQPLPLDS